MQLVVLSLLGSLTFVGELESVNKDFMTLRNAVCVRFLDSGVRLVNYHLPVGTYSTGKKGRLTCIPVSRIDFYTVLDEKDGDPLFSMYEDCFNFNEDKIIDSVVNEYFEEPKKGE